MTTKLEAIRALNDELRQNLTTGTAFMTAGVAALGAEAVARIVKTIAVYDDFCHANDPYEEHDFGSFEVDGQTIFFKIDYFDKCAAPTRRPVRSIGHRARDHDHVGGGVLTVGRAAAGNPPVALSTRVAPTKSPRAELLLSYHVIRILRVRAWSVQSRTIRKSLFRPILMTAGPGKANLRAGDRRGSPSLQTSQLGKYTQADTAQTLPD